MRFVILVLLTALLGPMAFAQNATVSRRLIKPPNTQKIVDFYSWSGPLGTNATMAVSAAIGTLAVEAPRTISTFNAQPDVARNVILTPSGSTGVIPVGTVAVSGKDIFNRSISENIIIGQGTTGVGLKAFKSLSSVVLPGATDIGAAFTVGYGDKLGINRCSDSNGYYLASVFDGAFETSRGTFSTHPTNVSLNTFTPQGSPDGSKKVELFYFQNWRCFQ